MRCLLIGPKYNGIANVIKVHKNRLEKIGLEVDWFGFEKLTFDLNDIFQNVENLLNKIDFAKYDIVDCHIGMYEAEQILLNYLDSRQLPPRILSVHSMSFELFKKIGFPHFQDGINKNIGTFFNGFIFYGTYGKNIFLKKYGEKAHDVIFIPPTHPDFKINSNDEIRFEKKYSLTKDTYIGLVGYPSKWKNWKLLLDSFSYVDQKITFVFAGPWWNEKLGFLQKRINNVSIKVIPQYLDGKDFVLFIKNSKFGVFPYINYPTFQGSGVLANYLWFQKPCIVSTAACLPEYIGKGGIILNSENPKDWGAAISKMLIPNVLNKYEQKIKKEAPRFRPEHYGKKIYQFYKKIISQSNGSFNNNNRKKRRKNARKGYSVN